MAPVNAALFPEAVLGLGIIERGQRGGQPLPPFFLQSLRNFSRALP